MGNCKKKVKNRTAGRESGELRFQEVESNLASVIPTCQIFACTSLPPGAPQQVWTCLYLSWQQHNRGKPAVQVFGYANKFFWQMPVSRLSATHEEAEGERQPGCSAAAWWARLFFLPIPALWVWGYRAPSSKTSIRTQRSHSWTLLPWCLMRLISPQASSNPEVTF